MGLLRALGLARSVDEPASMSMADTSSARMASSRPSAQYGVDVPPEMMEAMTGGGAIAPRIGRNEAMQVPAVMRGRNLICSTLASLPLQVHNPNREPVDGYLLGGNIDPDVPNVVTMANTLEDLLFEGVAWWRVTRFGWHGYPVAARWVPHDSVHVATTGASLPSQVLISQDQYMPVDGQVYIDGVPVPDEEIIRFDSPNPALLRHAARAIRTCLRLDRTAAKYADEPMPLGVFTDAENVDPLAEDEIPQVLDDWESARQTRTWAYVSGLVPKALEWDAEKIQLADQRQHAVLEISRAMGIDPEDLGVSTTSRTYANREQRNQHLLDFTLNAYATGITQRLSMRDILPRGYRTRIDRDEWLRNDAPTRMQTYQTGLAVGAWTTEEIRRAEGKPPLTSRQAAARRQPAQPQMEDDDVSTLHPSDIDFDDEPIEIAFDHDETAQTFQVDVERRTIVGMAVPWGKVARSGFSKWRFAPGSLRWSDPSRIKLNLNHDRRALIGRATRLQSADKGLVATFKVARGEEGDRALALAEDRVLDGLSIEIDFNDDAGDGWQPDPADETVRLVKQASLRGTALTGVPAFDDARVTRVAASHDHEGTGMTGTQLDDKTGGAPAEGFDFAGYMQKLGDQITESHKQLSEGLAQSIGESVSAGFKTALENLPAPQDGPQPVRAARFTVTREAPVYAMNGQGHSLVRDAWYAAREHDDEAIERLRKYRKQTEEMATLAAQYAGAQFAAGGSAQFAPQSTSTASEIIPPGYRPDLYVPELVQGRPLVAMCSRGTINNANPFTVPKFGSSSGAAGDHTEGTNPADGSLTFGTETVSPSGKSGRITLTREIVDSSNPAIDQIALQTMRESYNRQTEQEVYEALNGAATTTVTYAASSLITDVRDLLAQYPFVRFAAPTGAAMNQKVTRAFATAEDSTGRPLLPSVGAQNTAGLGNAVSQGWFIDGLTFQPAWSITDELSDDVVLILNRPDVWVWESPLLTFRFEEKQGPANIELNIFGYFGTHVLRPAGVFAVRNPAS